jgi:hypothetical protein
VPEPVLPERLRLRCPGAGLHPRLVQRPLHVLPLPPLRIELLALPPQLLLQRGHAPHAAFPSVDGPFRAQVTDEPAVARCLGRHAGVRLRLPLRPVMRKARAPASGPASRSDDQLTTLQFGSACFTAALISADVSVN